MLPRPALIVDPEPGTTTTLWTTALDEGTAYYTRILTRAGRTTSSVHRIRLPAR